MFDASVPHHWGYYWKSHYLPPLTEDAIEVLLERSWAKNSPASYTLLFHMGGAMADGPEGGSAASGRDAAHAMNINAAWPAGGPEHADISWCRKYFAAMEPHATGGVYVNFLHNDEGRPGSGLPTARATGDWRRSRPTTILTIFSAPTRTSNPPPASQLADPS